MSRHFVLLTSAFAACTAAPPIVRAPVQEQPVLDESPRELVVTRSVPIAYPVALAQPPGAFLIGGVRVIDLPGDDVRLGEQAVDCVIDRSWQVGGTWWFMCTDRRGGLWRASSFLGLLEQVAPDEVWVEGVDTEDPLALNAHGKLFRMTSDGLMLAPTPEGHALVQVSTSADGYCLRTDLGFAFHSDEAMSVWLPGCGSWPTSGFHAEPQLESWLRPGAVYSAIYARWETRDARSGLAEGVGYREAGLPSDEELFDITDKSFLREEGAHRERYYYVPSQARWRSVRSPRGRGVVSSRDGRRLLLNGGCGGERLHTCLVDSNTGTATTYERPFPVGGWIGQESNGRVRGPWLLLEGESLVSAGSRCQPTLRYELRNGGLSSEPRRRLPACSGEEPGGRLVGNGLLVHASEEDDLVLHYRPFGEPERSVPVPEYTELVSMRDPDFGIAVTREVDDTESVWATRNGGVEWERLGQLESVPWSGGPQVELQVRCSHRGCVVGRFAVGDAPTGAVLATGVAARHDRTRMRCASQSTPSALTIQWRGSRLALSVSVDGGRQSFRGQWPSPPASARSRAEAVLVASFGNEHLVRVRVAGYRELAWLSSGRIELLGGSLFFLQHEPEPVVVTLRAHEFSVHRFPNGQLQTSSYTRGPSSRSHPVGVVRRGEAFCVAFDSDEHSRVSLQCEGGRFDTFVQAPDLEARLLPGGSSEVGTPAANQPQVCEESENDWTRVNYYSGAEVRIRRNTRDGCWRAPQVRSGGAWVDLQRSENDGDRFTDAQGTIVCEVR